MKREIAFLTSLEMRMAGFEVRFWGAAFILYHANHRKMA